MYDVHLQIFAADVIPELFRVYTSFVRLYYIVESDAAVKSLGTVYASVSREPAEAGLVLMGALAMQRKRTAGQGSYALRLKAAA